ncbi:MAG: hypothetical protein ACTHK0_07915, partial [Ginsengibacter sp.]
MSLTYYILTAFLQLLLTVTFVYILSWLKEDVKNKSLLNHISELTQKTESVKKDFNEEMERVRHELEVLTNMQNVLFEESKNSIIEFLSNISNWYYNLIPEIFEYNQTNYESIDQRIAAMSRDYQLTNNSFSKIQLVVDNNSLIEAANDAFLGFLEAHLYVEMSLKTLKRNLISEKH